MLVNVKAKAGCSQPGKLPGKLPEGGLPASLAVKSVFAVAMLAALQDLQSRMTTAPDTITAEEWQLVDDLCLFYVGWKAGRKSIIGS